MFYDCHSLLSHHCNYATLPNCHYSISLNNCLLPVFIVYLKPLHCAVLTIYFANAAVTREKKNQNVDSYFTVFLILSEIIRKQKKKKNKKTQVELYFLIFYE